MFRNRPRASGSGAGFGLDKIRAHSRHRTIATLMIYIDQHDREPTAKTLVGRTIAT